MRRPIIAILMSFSMSAVAEPLDEAKLKLLSCIHTDSLSSSKRGALDWINNLPKPTRDGPGIITGPLWLGEACLKNTEVVGAFGAFFVKGEICNKSLNDFTSALSKIGLNLQKDIAVSGRKSFGGAVNENYEYSIFKGRLDLRSGQFIESGEELTFLCNVKGGRPQ